MGRLYGLDALRGIAALIVVALHVHIIFGLPHPFLSRGYLAVDFFFMLSGYVMARVYERNGSLKLPGAVFLWKRYRRFWPVMVIGAALASVAMVSDGFAPASVPFFVLPLFLMLPNVVSAHFGYWAFPGNLPAWSIFSELIANALHGAILSRLNTLGVGLVGIGALALTQVISPGLDLMQPEVITKGTLRAIAGYCVGIVLWRTVGERVLLPSWFGVAALPGAILLLSCLDGPYLDFVFFALCPLILLSGLGRDPTGCGGWLGALSFPLYAVHSPVMHLTEDFGGGPLLAVSLAVIAAVVTMLLTDKSSIVRRLLEPVTPRTG
jgi:peptidoglycan/LPS O-acetylase OafA/YrhL